MFKSDRSPEQASSHVLEIPAWGSEGAASAPRGYRYFLSLFSAEAQMPHQNALEMPIGAHTAFWSWPRGISDRLNAIY
jgi:hypothetical protein